MSFAQNTPLVVNNGASFFINGNLTGGDTTIVFVDGTVEHNDSVLINQGKLIVTGNYVNNARSGSFNPSNYSPETGLFEIYGDWENNDVFDAGKSRVRFLDTGLIKGSEVTRFYDLELVGHIVRGISDSISINQTGPTVDVEIDENGSLDLDYGEFATNFNVLWVFNPASGAIMRETDCDSCGFVSSLGNPLFNPPSFGSLARVVNQTVAYQFPTGSSVFDNQNPNSFKRYRPVTIQPTTADLDTFQVRFVNRAASVDNHHVDSVDQTICYTNPWWYHRINKRNGGVASADIGLYANFWEDDEPYNTIANWSVPNFEWENLGNSATANFPTFNQVVSYGWDEYLTYPEDAYIMAFNVPSEPNVEGDDALCANVPVTYTVPNNGSMYEFNVTGGIPIDSTDNSYTVIWQNNTLDAITGTLEVTETIPNNVNGGCRSLTRVYPVEVWALPVADFTVGTDSTLPGGIFVYDILEMQDSSLLTSQWEWDFDDGTTSTDSLPFHTYNDIGDYNIQLIVTSGLDCKDTLVVPVSVVEGLIVPNVFTPNNDGWNDVFDVRTSNVGPFKIEIYNRWGNVVFETTSAQISWDGSTLAGVEASSGTYFYVISKAELNSGNSVEDNDDNFDYPDGRLETGWVQLIR